MRRKRNSLLLAGKYLVLALCSASALATVAGCSKEGVEVRNVVTAYNKMLPEALSRPDAGVMEYFTTHYERGRIDAYIALLRTDKRLMVCDLKKLDFLETALNPDKTEAVVKTRESWSYYYIDEKTRKPVTREEELGYENTYRLVKESGRWVVNKVEARELTAKSKSE